MKNYPKTIEAIAINIAKYSQQLNTLRDKVARIESKHLLDIAAMKDDKDKLIYSNEATRNARLKITLSESEEYTKLSEEIAGLEMKKARAVASLERQRGDFKEHQLDRQKEIAVLQDNSVGFPFKRAV